MPVQTPRESHSAVQFSVLPVRPGSLAVTNDHTLSDLVSISIFEDDGQVYVLFFTSDECYIGPSQDAATNEIIKMRIFA